MSKLDYYTNVQVWAGKILYRGIKNGRRVCYRDGYSPSLFLSSKKGTKYTTIYGEPLERFQFDSIYEAKDFANKNKGIENFKIYGFQRWQYAYIADHFPNDIDWKNSDLLRANIDIEVGPAPDGGFAQVDNPTGKVTAITIKLNDDFVTFGCGDYVCQKSNEKYFKCSNERDLLRKFIEVWSSDYPDLVTGWNIESFDIPYLVNRIKMVLGDSDARKLSPWGIINEKEVDLGMNRVIQGYAILGIAALDLIDLYFRYAPEGKSQESYKLDNIAHVELGERKLSYEEYGSLHNLHEENYQRFIEYNIKDVELVERIDNKHRLIDLVLTLSYKNKCNYEDVFQQVRMWDIITFNHLKKKNQVVPPLITHEKKEKYIGAYVKEPNPAFYNHVASFDVTSEYPSTMWGWNISPETLVEPEDYTDEMREIIDQYVTIERLLDRQVVTDKLKKDNVCLTANGQFYRRDRQGFMGEMIEQMFADRKRYKKLMIEAQKELEKDGLSEDEKTSLEDKVSRYNCLQLAAKVSLNSLYGACGSQYFRFFDVRNAIAVTTTGQLAIRKIQNDLKAYLNKILKTDGEDYVIASDTDSVYLSLDKLVGLTFAERMLSVGTNEIITFMDRACEKVFQPLIDRSFEELGEYTNVYLQKLSMKREALCDKAIWTGKKRYILNVWDSEGVRYHKPKRKVMGLELKKSSTPTACREKLTEAVDLIMDTDEATVQQFVSKFREEFRTLPLEDIAFPRGINGLVKFADAKTVYGSGCPIHVRGALIYNHFLKQKKLDKKYLMLQNGEKLKFIFLKEPNTVQSNVISFPVGGIPKEFELDKYIDYETQFTKAFLDPLNIILKAIGWKAEKTVSLLDFFD